MTSEESKKLDGLIKSVKEIHDVFYKEPGIVHEVKGLCEWKKKVSTNFTWLGRILMAILLTQTTAAVIYFWQNSN